MHTRGESLPAQTPRPSMLTPKSKKPLFILADQERKERYYKNNLMSSAKIQRKDETTKSCPPFFCFACRLLTRHSEINPIQVRKSSPKRDT